MGIVDYIAIAAIVLTLSAAAFYIVRAKRSGQKCIGCPHSKQCSGKCSCGSANATKEKDNKHG